MSSAKEDYGRYSGRGDQRESRRWDDQRESRRWDDQRESRRWDDQRGSRRWDDQRGRNRSPQSRYESRGQRSGRDYFNENMNNLNKACSHLSKSTSLDMTDLLCIIGLIKYIMLNDKIPYDLYRFKNNNFVQLLNAICKNKFTYDEVNYIDTYIKNYINNFNGENEGDLKLIDDHTCRYGIGYTFLNLLNKVMECFKGTGYSFNLQGWCRDILKKVAAVILKGDPQDPEILLVQQSYWDPQYYSVKFEDIQSYYRKFGLPKGGMKIFFDEQKQQFIRETADQTAKRELQEEIGKPLLLDEYLEKINEEEKSKFTFVVYRLKDDNYANNFAVDHRVSSEVEEKIATLREDIYNDIDRENSIEILKNLLNNREIDFSKWVDLNTLENSDDYKIFANQSLINLLENKDKILQSSSSSSSSQRK